VLVNFTLNRDFIVEIEAVDPSVRVMTSYVPASPGESERRTLEVEDWRKKEGDELDALLAQAEVLFTFGSDRVGGQSA
jgi:hypothetical protein